MSHPKPSLTVVGPDGKDLPAGIVLSSEVKEFDISSDACDGNIDFIQFIPVVKCKPGYSVKSIYVKYGRIFVDSEDETTGARTYHFDDNLDETISGDVLPKYTTDTQVDFQGIRYDTENKFEGDKLVSELDKAGTGESLRYVHSHYTKENCVTCKSCEEKEKENKEEKKARADDSQEDSDPCDECCPDCGEQIWGTNDLLRIKCYSITCTVDTECRNVTVSLSANDPSYGLVKISGSKFQEPESASDSNSNSESESTRASESEGDTPPADSDTNSEACSTVDVDSGDFAAEATLELGVGTTYTFEYKCAESTTDVDCKQDSIRKYYKFYRYRTAPEEGGKAVDAAEVPASGEVLAAGVTAVAAFVELDDLLIDGLPTYESCVVINS